MISINKISWMTQTIFKDWINRFYRYIKSGNPSRKAILLVDNCASHRLDTTDCSYVTLHYLPLNAISHLQQCDAGIIKALISNFRFMFVN